MRIPIATYRFQFNSEFRFEQARSLVPYLASLGISDVYASPIFKAKPESPHGYDVVDPNQLNPELGDDTAFAGLVQEVQKYQMGWLQDIVPNHMSYVSQNHYLMDLLENGPNSEYVDFFDTLWNSPLGNSDEPILAPLLGDFYGSCLKSGEIQLSYDLSNLNVNYYSLKLPLRIDSYAILLTHNLGQLTRILGRQHPDFIKMLGILYILKNSNSELASKQRKDQSEFIKGLLWELYENNVEVKNFIDENIKLFNGQKANVESFSLLDRLLSEQFFRLSYWKVGAEEMNYRRFFTINELISVRVEIAKVFNHTHDLIFNLVESNIFTGLRIDHVDGLYNPQEYLERLKEKANDTFIIVEKILENNEELPEVWPVQGTSGYDFLNFINGVFCWQKHQSAFNRIYQKFTGNKVLFEEIALKTKSLILDKNLAGDLDNLVIFLKKIASNYRYSNDFTINGLKRALTEVLVHLSIYRNYTTPAGLLERDIPYIEAAIEAAKEQAPLLFHELDFIENLLLLKYEDSLPEAEKAQRLAFAMRIQQYTGPLMAKGIEDTAFYVYNRLISLNEVGTSPDRFGISLDEFHQFNQQRQAKWPHTLNASSTHDTKRGEDVRARINVLSEIPKEWEANIKKWQKLNQEDKTISKDISLPDANDEYVLYQTLIGTLPFVTQVDEAFQERLEAFMIKAIREAKVHTTWLRPNRIYEEACIKFVKAVLRPGEDNAFWSAFLPFQQKIAHYGIFNSLAQTLIKITSPGIPDFYRGTELWELNFVDPDNRRPVDFKQRQTYLNRLQKAKKSGVLSLITKLLQQKEDGQIKLFLIMQALQARAQYAETFQSGKYIPLEVVGELKEHIIAFARSDQKHTLITVVPRFVTSLMQPPELPLGKVWGETKLQLPLNAPLIWHDAITEQKLSSDGGSLPISDILQYFPVALLTSSYE